MAFVFLALNGEPEFSRPNGYDTMRKTGADEVTEPPKNMQNPQRPTAPSRPTPWLWGTSLLLTLTSALAYFNSHSGLYKLALMAGAIASARILWKSRSTRSVSVGLPVALAFLLATPLINSTVDRMKREANNASDEREMQRTDQLIAAARADDMSQLDALMESGISPVDSDRWQFSALSVATREGRSEAVRHMLAHASPPWYTLALLDAAYTGQADTLRTIVHAGGSINSSSDSFTPLMAAAAGCSKETLLAALKLGADANAALPKALSNDRVMFNDWDSFKFAPAGANALHVLAGANSRWDDACQSDDLTFMADALLDKGINIDAPLSLSAPEPSIRGETALNVALDKNQMALVTHLYSKGAKLNLSDPVLAAIVRRDEVDFRRQIGNGQVHWGGSDSLSNIVDTQALMLIDDSKLIEIAARSSGTATQWYQIGFRYPSVEVANLFRRMGLDPASFLESGDYQDDIDSRVDLGWRHWLDQVDYLNALGLTPAQLNANNPQFAKNVSDARDPQHNRSPSQRKRADALVVALAAKAEVSAGR